MSRKIISALLVFLLLTSVAIPTATAEPAPFVAAGVVAAAPETAELIIGGITAVVSGAVVIELGKNIGKTWDETAENWDNFCKCVSTELDKLFHAKEWIKVTSQEGKTVMTAVYECWNAGGSSGGKKDDKWYFEARIHDRQIEINPKRINEDQAVKEMGRGKHIMTVNEKLAKNLIRKFNNEPANADVMIEKHPRGKYGKEEFFKHGNFEANGQRCHVWVLEP